MRSWLAWSGIALLAVGYFAFWGLRGTHPDESFQYFVSESIRQGFLPYRDFYLHISPLSFWMSSAALSISDGQVWGFRLLLGFIFVLILASSGVLARVTGGSSKLAVLVMIPLGPTLFPVVTYNWLGLLVCSLSVIVALDRQIPTPRAMGWMGVLGMTAFATKQNLGAVVFVTLFLGIWYRRDVVWSNLTPLIISGLVSAFALLILPHLDHLDLLYTRTIAEMAYVKGSQFKLPFDYAGIKSALMVLGIWFVLGSMALLRKLQPWTYCSSLLAKWRRLVIPLIGSTGIFLFAFIKYNPHHAYDKLNWILPAYVYDFFWLSFVPLILLGFTMRLWRSPPSWYILAWWGSLSFIIGMTAGVDINHLLLLTPYVGISLIPLISKSAPLAILLFSIGVLVQAGAAPVGSFREQHNFILEKDNSFRSLWQTEKVKNIGNFRSTCTSLQDGAPKPWLIHGSGSIYMIPRQSNYWWYYDGAFSSSHFLRLIESEWTIKNPDVIVKHPSSATDYYVDTHYSRFAEHIREDFQRTDSGVGCPVMLVRKNGSDGRSHP